MNGERLRPAPESRFDACSLVFDVAAEANAIRTEGPARHGHRQKTLFRHGSHTVALFVLDAGAQLSEHAAAGIVTIQPVDGEIMVTADGRSQRLCVGHVLVLSPRLAHSVAALRPASFLLQVSLVAK